MHMHIDSEETRSIEERLEVIYCRLEELELTPQSYQRDEEMRQLLNASIRLEAAYQEETEFTEEEQSQLIYQPLHA